MTPRRAWPPHAGPVQGVPEPRIACPPEPADCAPALFWQLRRVSVCVTKGHCLLAVSLRELDPGSASVSALAPGLPGSFAAREGVVTLPHRDAPVRAPQGVTGSREGGEGAGGVRPAPGLCPAAHAQASRHPGSSASPPP